MREVRFTPELLRTVPGATARTHLVIPIADEVEGLVIATTYPFDLDAIDDLRRILGRDVELRYADADQLRTFVEDHYVENSP